MFYCVSPFIKVPLTVVLLSQNCWSGYAKVPLFRYLYQNDEWTKMDEELLQEVITYFCVLLLCQIFDTRTFW